MYTHTPWAWISIYRHCPPHTLLYCQQWITNGPGKLLLFKHSGIHGHSVTLLAFPRTFLNLFSLYFVAVFSGCRSGVIKLCSVDNRKGNPGQPSMSLGQIEPIQWEMLESRTFPSKSTLYSTIICVCVTASVAKTVGPRNMYISYILVSKSTPLAVTGPHGQLASLLYFWETNWCTQKNMLQSLLISAHSKIPCNWVSN